jgi:hypothetical protein
MSLLIKFIERNTMRTLSLLALCSTLVFSGCVVVVAPDGDGGRFTTNWGSNVKGNGDVKSIKREIANATGLSISGSVHTEVRLGLTPSIEIIGDSNVLALIRTEVVNNGSNNDAVLKIWSDDSYSISSPIRVIYTTTAISKIDASGSGRLSVSGFTAGDLALSKSGSGTIYLDGRINNVSFDVSGSGMINAMQLASRTVSVNKSGSGSIIVGAVSQNFTAETSGSGQVTVHGNPPQRSVNGKNVQFVTNATM